MHIKETRSTIAINYQNSWPIIIKRVSKKKNWFLNKYEMKKKKHLRISHIYPCIIFNLESIPFFNLVQSDRNTSNVARSPGILFSYPLTASNQNKRKKACESRLFCLRNRLVQRTRTPFLFFFFIFVFFRLRIRWALL